MIAPRAGSGAEGRLATVLRCRVLERIRRAARYRVAVIAAPAGYGKTVALRQYLEALDTPAVRYDVRVSESELLGFLRGLAAAFSALAPDLAGTVATAYTECTSENRARDLAQWMHAHIGGFSGTVALDDLHFAQRDESVVRFLTELIAISEDRIRWIIATRTAASLPVATWMAYGDMEAPVEVADLRMTLEEARAFAHNISPEMGDTELTDLLMATDGWATALNFALRSSTTSRSLREAASTSRELLYRYLAEQVYQGLPSPDQQLLMYASELHDIYAEVLERAGCAAAEARLEALRARTGFVSIQSPGVYRCHDLFRDFLRQQLRLMGAGVARIIQLRVAQALEQTGHRARALEAYGRLGEEQYVLLLLEQHGFDLFEAGNADSIRVALNGLRSETQERNPLAKGFLGLSELLAGRFLRAEALLKSAADASDGELKARFAVYLGGLVYSQGRDVVALLEPFANDDSLPEQIRIVALSFLASRYASRGRTGAAIAALRKLESFANVCPDPALAAQLLHRAGIAALALALPPQTVLALFERAAVLACEQGRYYTLSSIYGGMYATSMLNGDLEVAWRYAERAMSAARRAGHRLALETSLLQIIELVVFQGDVDEVKAYLDQIEAVAAVESAPADRFSYVGRLHTHAILAAWNGDFAKAYAVNVSLDDSVVLDFDRAMERALTAFYAVGCGRTDRAMALVQEALAIVDTVVPRYVHARIALDNAVSLCAAVAAFSGDLVYGRRILTGRAAVQHPAAEALRRCAWELCRSSADDAQGVRLQKMLADLKHAGRGGLALLFERMIARMHLDAGCGLTDSELAVLAAIAQGQSSKEIAVATGRSVHTVRTLTQRAIQKLGCSGRQQAIAAAQRQGLLQMDGAVRWA